MPVLQWLSDRLLPRATPRPEEQAIRDAIERVVEKTDPRLHLVKGYRKKLRPAVEASLRYARELVDRFPPPREVSSRTWNTDPAVHAFFSSVDDLKRTVSGSRSLRKLFENRQHGRVEEEAFALLAMTTRESKRFGVYLQGDALQQEVLQTSVGFVDRVVAVARPTEAAVRAALRQLAFEEIVLHALGHIASLRDLKTHLARERAMLQMRYRILQATPGKPESLFETAITNSRQLQTVETQLAENNRRLREMLGRFQPLEDSLRQIATILGDPHNYLTLTPIAVRLDRMNIVVDPGDPHGQNIDLLEATVIDRPPRVMQLMRCRREDFLTEEELLKLASRQLG
ncbi:MAG: hypothetical protein ACFCVA_03300 [Gammaproteobacteria bacterium]